MTNGILDKVHAEIPDKACMITIMFVPDSDVQAIEVKAKIDAALQGIETKRYSFNLEQRTPNPKTKDT